MTDMWRTPEGIRQLQGAEARLLQAATVSLHEQLKERGEPVEIGAPAFDRLNHEQQMFAVLAIAKRLTDDLRPLPLEAWSESTIFAIFECVHAEIAFEIGLSENPDGKPTFRWRGLVRGALIEKWGDGPAPTSNDVRDWDFSIVSLSKCVLWDLAFLDEENYDGSDCLPDYFAAKPPDWTPHKQHDLLNFHEQAVDEVNRLAA